MRWSAIWRERMRGFGNDGFGDAGDLAGRRRVCGAHSGRAENEGVEP